MPAVGMATGYGLVTRRGMPLSPAAAAVRDLLVAELGGEAS